MAEDTIIVASTTDPEHAVAAAAAITPGQLAAGMELEAGRVPNPQLEDSTADVVRKTSEEQEADHIESISRERTGSIKTGVQKRIDKLTARNYQIDEENSRLRARLAELEQTSRQPEPEEHEGLWRAHAPAF